MMTIYLVTAGLYAQRTIICAFDTEPAAREFVQRYTANPPRSLGPTAPMQIIDVACYPTVRDALEHGAPTI